jgi:simple sugar transport system ATP-binding protein
MHDGVIKNFSVAENLVLQDHVNKPYSNGLFMNFKKIDSHAQDMIVEFNIKTPGIDTPIKNLSGGNIQKLILARELSRRPRVLIAAQPTRGVDIGATEYIHNQLLQQRADGLATLLISEDLDEVQALADRIVVMFGGEIMGVVNSEETNIEEIGLMMAGERLETIRAKSAEEMTAEYSQPE